MGIYSDNYTLYKGDDVQTFLDIHVVHEFRVGIDVWRPEMSVSPWKSWGMCHFRSSEKRVLNWNYKWERCIGRKYCER